MHQGLRPRAQGARVSKYPFEGELINVVAIEPSDSAVTVPVIFGITAPPLHGCSVAVGQRANRFSAGQNRFRWCHRLSSQKTRQCLSLGRRQLRRLCTHHTVIHGVQYRVSTDRRKRDHVRRAWDLPVVTGSAVCLIQSHTIGRLCDRLISGQPRTGGRRIPERHTRHSSHDQACPTH